MPYSVSDVGGLAVAFNPSDQREVQRALDRLDRELFLDKELSPIGPRGPYVYYVVKHHIGSGVPPIAVLEWRDESGPWPLTMAIVEKVRRTDEPWEKKYKRILDANEKKRQEAINAVGEGSESVAREGYKSVRGTRSVNLPRSQSLRMSRDKARNRGEKK